MAFQFTPEHIRLIIDGKKWETRRVCKENEWLSDLTAPGAFNNQAVIVGEFPNEHIKWQTMVKSYAVVPGRGKPGVWYAAQSHLWGGLHDVVWPELPQELRIRITAIRQEYVQDISEDDARAEGVQAIECYRVEYFDGKEPLESYRAGYAHLWNSINTRKGTRWQDNPLVWALTFEVVRS